MTMQNLPHPDDELLAAYAGGDPDALVDASLVAHLSSCDRCRPLVNELSLLRGALAELPDIAPSRPLRLIPPVPVPAASAAPAVRGSWLRRLTAPAMAAGAGLALIGAIGISASGPLSATFSNVGEYLKGGGVTQQEGAPAPGVLSPSLAPGDTATGGGTNRGSEVPRSAASGQPLTPRPTASSGQHQTPRPSAEGAGGKDLGTPGTPEQPWLMILLAGVGIFGISGTLRFSLVPRAG